MMIVDMVFRRPVEKYTPHEGRRRNRLISCIWEENINTLRVEPLCWLPGLWHREPRRPSPSGANRMTLTRYGWLTPFPSIQLYIFVTKHWKIFEMLRLCYLKILTGKICDRKRQSNSGMWRRAVRYKFIDVSEELSARFFGLQELLTLIFMGIFRWLLLIVADTYLANDLQFFSWKPLLKGSRKSGGI